MTQRDNKAKTPTHTETNMNAEKKKKTHETWNATKESSLKILYFQNVSITSTLI